MKVEAIHGECFATREEMRHTVFEYIEVDYNRNRRHSASRPLKKSQTTGHIK
jgi:putative transposase